MSPGSRGPAAMNANDMRQGVQEHSASAIVWCKSLWKRTWGKTLVTDFGFFSAAVSRRGPVPLLGSWSFEWNASPINLTKGSLVWVGSRDLANKSSSQIVFLRWGVCCALRLYGTTETSTIEVLRHLLSRRGREARGSRSQAVLKRWVQNMFAGQMT